MIEYLTNIVVNHDDMHMIMDPVALDYQVAAPLGPPCSDVTSLARF